MDKYKKILNIVGIIVSSFLFLTAVCYSFISTKNIENTKSSPSQSTVTEEKTYIDCSSCTNGYIRIRCFLCKGSGSVRYYASNYDWDYEYGVCSNCRGSGYESETCSSCGGKGGHYED